MSSLEQRQSLVTLIHEAVAAGARQSKACKIIGISQRTLQRWLPAGTQQVLSDQRPFARRAPPANKLSEAEQDRILQVCNLPEYASLPPSQIVPRLADQGQYLGSESSFYRILKARNQQHHRGRSQRPRPRRSPTTHTATQPNQVWMWDISYLPSRVKGQFFYLYMVEDLYSRYAVNWEVHERESGELAAELIEKACWREKLHDRNKPVLHQDNGAPMKASTLASKLQSLGIVPSYSRPRVSDDNAYVESFFRTLKYVPQWPSAGFVSLQEAREWMHAFMHWYHEEHQHSGIRFVTPGQRHRGEDHAILQQRDAVYAAAKAAHPERWSGDTRNWTPAGAVTLNPDRQPQENLKGAA